VKYTVGVNPEIAWTAAREAHIARHHLTAAEVEQVLANRPRWSRPSRDDVTVTFGQTGAGRYLAVLTAEGEDGRTVVVTAREMKTNERLTFRRKGR